MTVTCGLGREVPYEEFMQLINDAFGFTGTGRDFRTLLPKLYRPGRAPQNENYVVTEDSICVAAVGAFSHEIRVCGLSIPCRGIGNVAVARNARSRGYMKDCMNMALSDMVKDGIALSTLGGRRQRYRYFSYDKCGQAYTFVVNSDNLRHTFGEARKTSFDVRKVTEQDEALLTQIMALSSFGPYAPVRHHADFYDIMTNWQAALWAATEGNTVIGYAVLEPDGLISEIKMSRDDGFLAFVTALHDTLGVNDLRLRLPPYQSAYVASIAPVAESCQEGCSMSYTVLNYRLVTEAFFRLKATYDTLPDGVFSLLIHGFAGDERLTLSVSGGVPSVRPLAVGETPNLELSHNEAMNMLFAPLSPARKTLPPVQRLWFPLPLWMYRADEV